MQYDVWSVKTPQANLIYFAPLDEYTTNDAFVIANPVIGYEGWGFQVSFTANDDDETGVNLSVTGVPVGALDGQPVTEVVTGGDGSVSANTVFTNTHFASVTALAIDSNTAGNVSIGFGGTLALPRTRVKGLYYVGSESAGSITIERASSSRVILEIDTPASNVAVNSLYMAAEGILTTKTNNDYATVTLVNVSSATLICG
jgi:hypothetical protein